MTRKTRLVVSLRRAKGHRVIGYLLFLLFVYGAAAEAAHNHGLVTPGLPSVAAVSDAGGSQSSYQSQARHKECSMCQFQRQLFDGLVQAPLFARTALAELAFVATLTVFHPSTSTTSTSGRAPPLMHA